MFQSLHHFYISDTWRKFRAAEIAERTSKKDGILYSEFSGKPITKLYDIVLHHKKPLTMQNVNDYSVSLNPDNIQIVTQSEHNEIHNRFGYCAERKVYFVYGAPCSGKTAFVNSVKGNSDIVYDMDNIWQCITGGERYVKPDALKANAFIVRDALLDSIKRRAGKWERAYVIAGGAHRGERERQINALRAEAIFIDTDKQACLERVATARNSTPQQSAEWIEYINQWFNEYQE